MKRGFAALSVLCFTILAMTFSAGTASAAQQSLPSLSRLQSQALVKPARYDYREYCVKQYFTCRDRWGGGARFERCMKWRDCWDAYVEFRERRERRQHRHHYEERNDDEDVGEGDREGQDEDDHREGYSCHHWQDACAQNWGYGTNDYYGCLKYYSCD